MRKRKRGRERGRKWGRGGWGKTGGRGGERQTDYPTQRRNKAQMDNHRNQDYTNNLVGVKYQTLKLITTQGEPLKRLENISSP